MKFDPSPDVLISPCDGLLSAYNISDDTVIPVKQSRYTVTSLLKDIDLANNTGKDTVNPKFLAEILKVDVEGWKKEVETVGESYDEYDRKASKDSKEENAAARRVPNALRAQLAEIKAGLCKK